MKTSVLTTVLVGALLMFSGASNGNTPKKLKPLFKTNIELNLMNFCNYLENGNPHKTEGIYSSPDKRYVIALIKNDRAQHDFIGVVISADNAYWTKGDIKFNFVVEGDNLNGYYYDSKGNYIPVSFTISSDTLETKVLKKVDVEEVKLSNLAYFTE